MRSPSLHWHHESACVPMNAIELPIPPSYLVEGPSMLPSLAHGQHIIARPAPGTTFSIARGDIVALKHPLNEAGVFIKRVIALPDEFVQLKEDAVFINERPLAEAYLDGPACPANRYARQWITASDEYFVMGDNRRDSLDSRYFGPITAACILGVVWYQCCPKRGLC